MNFVLDKLQLTWNSIVIDGFTGRNTLRPGQFMSTSFIGARAVTTHPFSLDTGATKGNPQ